MAMSRTLMALAIAATLVIESAMSATYRDGDSDGKRYFITGMKVQIEASETPPSPPPSADTPPALPPAFGASPPAPPTGPSSPPSSPTPAPESPAPPFLVDLPLNPSAAPTNLMKPPPPPSSAYKCSFRVDLLVGFSFVIIMFLAL